MRSTIILKISGSVIAFLGIVSLFMTTSVIFDLFGIRAQEGNYVLFIVVANFICAFIYLIAAYGFFTKKKWTTMILNIAAGILIVAFICLGIYIYSGGIYEHKTIGAMIFRTLLNVGFAFVSYKYISPKETTNLPRSN